MLGNELVLISPDSLRLPPRHIDQLRSRGATFEETSEIHSALETLDVLYVTRIQKERFPDPMDYERVRNAYRVDREALAPFGPKLKVLHPLPRVNEVATEVDDLPGVIYFQQSRNGVTVRMALLDLILGGQRGEERA